MTDVAGVHWPPERVTLSDTTQGIFAGVDTLPMSDEQRFSGPESERPFGMPAQRTPVVFDPDTGGLRIGEHVRRVEDPSEPNQVYGAYLSLLYAVRGAKPGEQLPLRAADLEALLLIVGDDPETIEQRLIGLMGCSAEEAKVLGGILLRHRKTTAALGVAASLLLGGSLASGIGGGSPDGAELVQSVSTESGQPSEAPSSASAGTAIAGVTSPTGTSVVLAPASGGGTTTTASVPVTGGSSSSTDGGTAIAAPPAPTRAPQLPESAAPVVAETPATVAEPSSPVEVEPVDRDLPPAPGRPIGGTVGGEEGDGSSFEEPVAAETPAPVDVPVPPIDVDAPAGGTTDPAAGSGTTDPAAGSGTTDPAAGSGTTGNKGAGHGGGGGNGTSNEGKGSGAQK